LFNSDSESNDAWLATALGLDNAYGYHIEYEGQAAEAFWARTTPNRTHFPCVDDSRSYAGCLGHYCPATDCWAGALVASAPHSPTPRPRAQRPGARCHRCGNIAPDHHVSGAVELLTCLAGHFDCPITASCLRNRRIPLQAPIPCTDYWPAKPLSPNWDPAGTKRPTALGGPHDSGLRPLGWNGRRSNKG
jgi:hypothetical protein